LSHNGCTNIISLNLKTVLVNQKSPSLVLRSHIKSLEDFINNNMDSDKFQLSTLADEVETCLQMYCRRDHFNTKLVTDFQITMLTIEKSIEDSFSKVKIYCVEQGIKQKPNKKDPYSKNNNNNNESSCCLCSQVRLLTKYPSIPDYYTKDFPKTYSRRYLVNDTFYLCGVCSVLANDATTKITSRISENYGLANPSNMKKVKFQKLDKESPPAVLLILDLATEKSDT
jgi:hypothetical protein